MIEARRRRTAITVAAVLVAGFISGAAGVAAAASASAVTPALTPAVSRAAAPAAAGPGTFVTVVPTRILDTRTGAGGVRTAPVAAHGSISFTVTGGHGVPSAAGVSAVVFNLTDTVPSAGGYIRAYPSGRPMPATSSLNFAARETRAHTVVVAPGTGGKVTLYNGSAGSVELLADITGYYTAGAPVAGGEFAPLTPARVLDTRTGLGAPAAPVKHGVPLTVQLAGRGGIPATGVSTVVLNVTLTGANESGFLNAASAERADTSSVNFRPGQTVSNLIVVPLSNSGTATLTAFMNGNFAATVQAIADVSGYFLSGPPSAPGRLGSRDPARLIDTRGGGAGPIPAHGSLAVSVAGQLGIPQTGVSAAILNVTVAGPRGSGYVTAYPSGTTRPSTSTVNFAGHDVSNLVIVAVGSDGKIRLSNQSSAPVDVIVDVSGFVGRIPGPLAWSPRTAFPTGSEVSGVSCASATFCVAAEENGAVLFFNGTTWSAPQTVTTEGLDAISCPVAGVCVALAADAAFVYTAGTWTRTTLPRYASTISCLSASFCLAAYDEAHALVYNGSTWTSTDTGLPLGDDGDGDVNHLVVACASTTLCLGAGTDGATARFDGTRWTRLSDLSSFASSMSCPSATRCVAISLGGQAFTFNGTTWSAPVPLPAPSFERTSLGCGSTNSCVAVTQYDGELQFYNGTVWTTPVTLGIDELTDISCPTATFCVAVDSSGAIVGR